MGILILRREYLRNFLVELKRKYLNRAEAGLDPILIFVWLVIPQLLNLSYFNRYIKLRREEYIPVAGVQVLLDSLLMSEEILKRKNSYFKVEP